MQVPGGLALTRVQGGSSPSFHFFAITPVYYHVLIRYLKRLQTQSHLSARARLPILGILQLVRIAQSFPFTKGDIKPTDRWSATKPEKQQLVRRKQVLRL